MGPDSESTDQLLLRFDHEVLSENERWDIAKRAERLADAAGDIDALYAIRMRLIGCSHAIADSHALLSLFLWCAHKHDSDPSRFPTRPVAGNDSIDLLWYYKWLTGLMCSWPQYSLNQIRTAISMMKAAYQRAGAGRSGILWAELDLARELGSEEQMRDVLAQIHTTPPDEYSNCGACSRANEVGAWRYMDNDARALELLDEILAGGYTCAEEPETILSESLLLLLRHGRTEQAVEIQERTYPRIMQGPAHFSAQLHHAEFFVATGNPAKAYELVCRHISSLWHEGLSPAGKLAALISLLRIASALIRGGHGDLPVPGTESAAARKALNAPATTHVAGSLTIDQFALLARAEARSLAAQFDRRNGTANSTDAVERAEADKAPIVSIDLGGQSFPDEQGRHAPSLIPSSPIEKGSFRDWMDLAYEVEYMERVVDRGVCLANAFELAATPDQRYEALLVALQNDKIPDFDGLLAQLVDLMRELGRDEYADGLQKFGWKLWRDDPPADADPGADTPFLDPVTEIRAATDVGWRFELALLMIETVSAPLSEKFEEWNNSGAELEQWDRRASERIERTLRVPEGLWLEHAHDLHAELLSMLDAGRAPEWDFLMAYSYAHGRVTDLGFSTLEALRCGNNHFSTVPPDCQVIRRTLTLQQTEAREYGAAALELTALWGLTTIAVYSGGDREQAWDRRIEEMAQTVHHPYLAVRLRSDSAHTSSMLGNHEHAVALLRDALTAFDRAGHLRPSMDATELRFANRSTILESLFNEYVALGDPIRAMGVSTSLIENLRHEDIVPSRERRLIEALQTYADLVVTSGEGDIFAAHNAISEARSLAESFPDTSDDWRFIRADIAISQAAIGEIFDEPKDCVQAARRASRDLEELDPEIWSGDLAERYARLATIVFDFDIELGSWFAAEASRLSDL